jgi:hypothetical protein
MAIKTPQEITINNFNGVDLSSPTFQINSSRATSSVNFLKKDGINQKRNSVENVMVVANAEQDYIKGVFSFTDSSQTKRLVVVSGSQLILMSGIGSDKTFIQGNDSFVIINDKDDNPITFETEEKFVSGWVRGDRLYLLFPGTDYVVLYYSEEEERVVVESLVNNIDLTYIPLTRFGATAEGTGATAEFGIAYDDLNMLTQWKKNNFRTGLFQTLSDNPYNTSEYFKYPLDSKVYYQNQSDLSLMKLKINYLETTAFSNISNTNWDYNATVLATTSSDVNIFGAFKKVVYSTTNPGREFRTTDALFGFEYKPVFLGGNYLKTNYYNLDNVQTLVVYDSTAYPYNTYPYPMSATIANKVVIDLREAVDDGYLSFQSNLANGHVLFYVSKGDFGGDTMNLSVLTKTLLNDVAASGFVLEQLLAH